MGPSVSQTQMLGTSATPATRLLIRHTRPIRVARHSLVPFKHSPATSNLTVESRSTRLLSQSNDRTPRRPAGRRHRPRDLSHPPAEAVFRLPPELAAATRGTRGTYKR